MVEKRTVLITKPDGTEQWYIHYEVMTYRNKVAEVEYENYFPIE